MKVIPPQGIGDQIIALLNSARVRVIVVSPYNKLYDWPAMVEAIKGLRRRNVSLTYFVRDDAEQIDNVRTVGIEPVPVPRLHAKYYLNEREAIFGSMNLSSASDSESLELAVQTETAAEYQAIADYHDRYLERFLGPERAVSSPPELLEEAVCRMLASQFPEKSTSYHFSRDGLKICVGRRNFYLSLDRRRGQNWLKIYGILPEVLADYLIPRQGRIQRRSRSGVEIVRGNERVYSCFRLMVRVPDGSPRDWSEKDTLETARFVASCAGAVFAEISEAPDTAVSREL